jgi:SAM-dependent methyltransferase
LADVKRIAYNINLSLQGRDPRSLSICDIGGGIGLFSVGCAAIGFREVILVDDFEDEVNRRLGEGILELHQRFGVIVIRRDAVRDGLGSLAQRNFDAITCFDSMEHWHQSPKRLFHQVVDSLQLNGIFVLGVPNCVNMRKRLTVPFGRGKWSSMDEWYERDVFRGHVREPDVGDLLYIATDMGVEDVQIRGRNWAGYASLNKLTRMLTRVTDLPLRAFPSLCSDIYLIAKRFSKRV